MIKSLPLIDCNTGYNIYKFDRNTQTIESLEISRPAHPSNGKYVINFTNGTELEVAKLSLFNDFDESIIVDNHSNVFGSSKSELIEFVKNEYEQNVKTYSELLNNCKKEYNTFINNYE